MARSVTLETNFSAGWISEAAAGDLTNEQRESGLVIAENVEILRDGGLRTRPGLQLVAGPFPRIQYSPRISVDTDGWTIENVATNQPVDLSVALRAPASGILPLGWRLRPSAAPYRFSFTFGGRAVRAVTLHECRLVLGNAVKQDGSLVFETQRREVGATAFTAWGEADQDDHLAQNVFAPGLVSRDITVRLKDGLDTDERDGLSFVLSPPAVTVLALEIGALSVFEELKADGTPAQAVSDDSQRLDLGRQHRLIPWVLGEQHVALVIGLDRISGFLLNDREDLPRLSLFDSVGDWLFTPRQLREMTWCRYERGLLLFHTDFPPLNVRITDAGEFSIAPLVLENVPDLPARLASSARGEISVRGGRLAITRAAGTLPPPQGVSAVLSVTRDNQIDVSWQEAADATSYDLMWEVKTVYDADPAAWRAARAPSVTSASLPGSVRIGLTALTGSATGLTGGTEYVFFVRAVYPEGVSELSEIETATSYPTPGQVTGLAVVIGDAANERDLTWTAVPFTSQYEVQVRVQGTTAWMRVGTSSTNSAQFLATDTTAALQFRVRALSLSGQAGAWSAVVSVAGVPDLANASGLSAALSATVANRIDVSWTLPSGATSIELQWRTASAPAAVNTVTLSAVSAYAHTGRTAGAQYAYRVRASDRFGRTSAWTDWSAYVTSYPLPGRPSGLSATSSATITGRIDVSWTNPNYVRDVQLAWRAAGTTGSGTVVNLTTAAASYAHTGRTIGSRTQYRVRIRDLGGRYGAWTAWSGAVTASQIGFIRQSARDIVVGNVAEAFHPRVLAADDSYVYAIGRPGSGNFVARVWTTAGVRQASRDITLGTSSPNSAASDGTYLYVQYGDDVRVWTVAGVRQGTRDFDVDDFSDIFRFYPIAANSSHVYLADESAGGAMFAITPPDIRDADSDVTLTSGSFPTALAADDTHVYAANNFNVQVWTVGGVRQAALDVDMSADFTPAERGSVYGMAKNGSTLYRMHETSAIPEVSVVRAWG